MKTLFCILLIGTTLIATNARSQTFDMGSEDSFDLNTYVAEDRYRPGKALLLSSLPLLGVGLGAGLGILSYRTGAPLVNVMGALAGFAVAEAAYIVGPSAGHFYIRNKRYAFWTMGVRAALGIGTLVSWLSVLHDRRLLGLAIPVSAVAAGFAIWNIVTLPKAVRTANEQVREKMSFKITPFVTRPSERSSLAFGAALSGTF